MKVPKYLSPTSIGIFQKDEEDYYLRYLADVRQAREPQTQPMSIGSAFDAFAKSYLHEALFGKGHDPQYDKRTLFEEQVEEHNREWAWKNGNYVFNQYKDIGCLADLMIELNKSVGDPRFEFTINDTITTQAGEVPLLGKPDIFFINDQGARVILDWKVNGYCSKYNFSPMKGYVKLRQVDKLEKMHPKCELIMSNGILINGAMCLEEGNESWADQLSIYSWLLGEEFGSENMIVGIDQIVGNPEKLRFATHRLKVSPDYQYELVAVIAQMWEIINSDHIFRALSFEDSALRCELLDKLESGSAFQEALK